MFFHQGKPHWKANALTEQISSETSQDRVAVITGGSRGIGLAMARVFADAGYAVIITGRDPTRLSDAVADLKERGGWIDGITCDVCDPAAVAKLFEILEQQYRSIDVLVNNAGVAHELLPVDKLPVETWKQVIDTNLTGTFLVTRAALPLIAAGGTIVNNLSIAAVQPFSGMSAYNAAKFGALGFTKALREEVRKQRIRVLALIPGATNTDIWQQFWPEAPREKMMSPQTVAEAVLHAVSAPAEASVEEIVIGPTAGVL
jgi:NAD(P)-dependent dehydrogenase (short-subunit alcohol dehydrogenase family)